MGKYADVLINEEKALEIDESIGNKKGECYDYEDMGHYFEDMDNHPQAMKAYLQSLKIANETGNQKGMGNDYSDIGNIYYVQGNYNDALKNQLQAGKTDEIDHSRPI